MISKLLLFLAFEAFTTIAGTVIFAWIKYSGNTIKAVYIVGNGRTFHNRNCRYLRGTPKAISRDNAVRRGFTPCKSCNP